MVSLFCSLRYWFCQWVKVAANTITRNLEYAEKRTNMHWTRATHTHSHVIYKQFPCGVFSARIGSIDGPVWSFEERVRRRFAPGVSWLCTGWWGHAYWTDVVSWSWTSGVMPVARLRNYCQPSSKCKPPFPATDVCAIIGRRYGCRLGDGLVRFRGHCVQRYGTHTAVASTRNNSCSVSFFSLFWFFCAKWTHLLRTPNTLTSVASRIVCIRAVWRRVTLVDR